MGEAARLWWNGGVTTTSTIAAIATGGAPGGIGVVRVSGPAALAAARAVASGLPDAPKPRHAYLTPLVDDAGRALDEGLALYFQAPASFTGEDVVELHAHGAPRLLELLLGAVLRHPGVRLAEAGEFTRRAFLNGRVDLARAEAVADLVAAESEAQVRAAASQLTGELSARLAAVRAPLVALHADLEGALDFPDEASGAEGDVPARLAPVRAQVEDLLAAGRQGALVRRGARVVLYGPVNAGKSTLFNRLVGAARALVDPEPGTTRDVLEARVELGGLAVTLVDTAGLREAPGRLEALGIERAREALAAADVALLLLPPDSDEAAANAWRSEASEAVRIELWGKSDLVRGSVLSPAPSPEGAASHAQARGGSGSGLRAGAGEREGGKSWVRAAATADEERGEWMTGVPVPRGAEGPLPSLDGGGEDGRPLARGGVGPLTSSDGGGEDGRPPARDAAGPLPSSDGGGEGGRPLARGAAGPLTSSVGVGAQAPLRVSGQTGEGLEALRGLLVERLGGLAPAVRVSSERHLDALRRAAEALERADAAARHSTLEVVSGEVGLALAALADITGEDVSTELLDAVFARFCIGK